jgi:hypothetical protein
MCPEKSFLAGCDGSSRVDLVLIVLGAKEIALFWFAVATAAVWSVLKACDAPCVCDDVTVKRLFLGEGVEMSCMYVHVSINKCYVRMCVHVFINVSVWPGTSAFWCEDIWPFSTHTCVQPQTFAFGLSSYRMLSHACDISHDI